MVKSGGLVGRKEKQQELKQYHREWAEVVKNNLLPGVRRAMHEWSVAHLLTQVEVIRQHLCSYYDALDATANNDAATLAVLLHPAQYRTSLEPPFLWLGDLHPYLFTNLLRSFLDTDNDDDDDGDEHDDYDSAFQLRLRTRFPLMNPSHELFNRPWHIVTAWKNPSPALMARIDQIGCGVRLMVPALMARARAAQAGFVTRLATL